MDKKISLNRDQLKIIAIIAMVVDHTAWGFVDFMSPLGQAMHIFGRLTLPIMCFFIAEGFSHTSNIRKYVERMATFAVVSIIPFYVFFHEEYDYRQNIIFDLLLGLLALCALEHKEFKKPVRLLLVALLFVISAAIGGWVIMPIVYILIFYYKDTFKKKAIAFCTCTVLMEVFLFTAIVLNQRYHYSHYDWTIAERVYLFGFMLALIPLYFYNGEKGHLFEKSKVGRYFFYGFYPVHFLALVFIKHYILMFNAQRLYIIVHVIALFIALLTFLYVIRVETSRAQMATVFFLISAIMYIFGFLLEITTSDVAGAYTATKMEYFSECLVFIAVTFCVQELCNHRVPTFVYAGEIAISVFTMWSLFTYEKNHLFYESLSMDTSRSVPKLDISAYGPAFYIFVLYSAVVCLYIVRIGSNSIKYGNEIEKKRLNNLLYAMLFMWMPFLLKALGLTGGYEIPAFGVAGAAVFVARCFGKYQYLDSSTITFNNALNRGGEGILVVDTRNNILYHNERIHSIFGQLENHDNVSKIRYGKEIFEGKMNTIEINDHTYELKVEPLIEANIVIGKMLWVIDLTEHYKELEVVSQRASLDALTGINNRFSFEKEVSEYLEAGGSGTLGITDLDNFKRVNDTYGHTIGDEVLCALGDTMKALDENIITGRIGGDEFCLFVKDVVDKEELSKLGDEIIETFAANLRKLSCGEITSVTLGFALMDQSHGHRDDGNYKKLFKRADRALYSAKEAGKRTYHFYSK